MQIAAFDIVPTDMIYEDFFGFHKPEPLNDNLEAEGYETTYFIYNVGSIIIPILVFPLLIIVFILLKCCRNP